MTDAEFMDELVVRLNLMMEADVNRTSGILGIPLKHLGYANVVHFISHLGFPRGTGGKTAEEAIKAVKFIVPVSNEDGRITGFEAVSTEELHRREESARAEANSDEPLIQ